MREAGSSCSCMGHCCFSSGRDEQTSSSGARQALDRSKHVRWLVLCHQGSWQWIKLQRQHHLVGSWAVIILGIEACRP